MIAGVIRDAELRGTGVGYADPEVLVFVVGEGQIGGHWTQPVAVGGQPAPCLPAKDFPLAAFQVHKVKAQPVGLAIHALIDVGSIVAAEISFDVGSHIVAAELVRNLEVETGILRGGAKLRELPLRRVAEGYGGEVGGNVALGVRGAEYIFRVHEPAGSQYRVAQLER